MRGYCEITMNGQPVGLRFALPAIRFFYEALEQRPDLYTLGDSANFTIEGLAKFIQAGYINQCDIKEVKPVLTYEDFFNYSERVADDESRAAEVKKVFECFGETVYAKKIAEISEDVEKKSVIGIT